MWEQIIQFYFTFLLFRVADFPGAIIPLKPKGEEHWAFPPCHRAGRSQILPLLPHSTPFAVPQFPRPAPPLPTSQGCRELPFLKHFEALWGKALETCVCWSEPGGFALPKAPVVSPPRPQCRTRAHHLGNFLLFLPRQYNNPQTEMYIFARSTNLQVFLII